MQQRIFRKDFQNLNKVWICQKLTMQTSQPLNSLCYANKFKNWKIENDQIPEILDLLAAHVSTNASLNLSCSFFLSHLSNYSLWPMLSIFGLNPDRCILLLFVICIYVGFLYQLIEFSGSAIIKSSILHKFLIIYLILYFCKRNKFLYCEISWLANYCSIWILRNL